MSLPIVEDMVSFGETLHQLERIDGYYEGSVGLNDNKSSLELVDLPCDRKPIHSKWVLKVKLKEKGSTGNIKHVSTKSFTHREGIDNQKTFSLVMKFTYIRLVLAVLAHLI